jgi:SPP1 gp7 family putative phage head morphogenesis protein
VGYLAHAQFTNKGGCLADFQIPLNIERSFQGALGRLISEQFPTRPNGQFSEEWLTDFSQVLNSPAIAARVDQLAARMVRWVNIENAKDWRTASARSQRSRMLYRLLDQELKGKVGARLAALTSENSRLIRSLPQDITRQLAGEIAKAQQMGSRPEAITKMLRVRFPEVAQSRVHLIARTQVSKASTELTQARSEELDLPWFIWRTAEDQRVRRSHRLMDGVVIAWRDLPSPEQLAGEKSSLGRYAPGACPYCRCIPLPILTLSDAFGGNESRRVYMGGSLTRMTRAQFARMSGIESRAA